MGKIPPQGIDRVSANDATTLATDRGPAPMNIGVILVVEGGAALELDQVRTLLSSRVPLVPRLRQRLVATPLGCGRPLWVDDEDFAIARHVDGLALTPRPTEDAAPADGSALPGGEAALLEASAALVCTPLPRDRPLWAARWVTGLDGDDAVLVLSAHHVLADGLGGLAVLAALGDPPDGAPSAPAADGLFRPFPSPAPAPRELAREVWRARVHDLRRTPARLTGATTGLRELVGSRHRPRLAARTSLNRPTGGTRRLTTVSRPLAAVVETAHRHSCTVNDVVLCAVAGAVGDLLRSRGEHVEQLVASVPVSDRRSTSADRLGNHTGVMPLTLPLVADPRERLRAISALTVSRKVAAPGASSAPLGLAFRALARVGAFQVFVDHQRLVHTFVTNVRGPDVPWHVAGHRVRAVIPLAVTPGNVGVSFDVLSYAGRLVVTIVADPAVVPDQDRLTSRLAEELTWLEGDETA